MRFIMIGLVAITIGFIVLGVFGAQFTEITVQTKEFSECYKYPEDQQPIKIECNAYLQEKNMLFVRSEEHTSELQSLVNLLCRLLLSQIYTLINSHSHF